MVPHPMEGAAAPRRGRTGGPKPSRGSSSAARRGNGSAERTSAQDVARLRSQLPTILDRGKQKQEEPAVSGKRSEGEVVGKEGDAWAFMGRI